MPTSIEDISRRAAQRLSSDFDPKLPGYVEAQLQGGGKRPERFDAATLIALATLVLNVAKFAWDIYRDHKKDNKAAPWADTMARTIRLELKTDDGISIAQRDKIISIVVDETLKQAPGP